MEAEPVSVEAAVAAIQEAFPRIYVACHLEHRRAGRHGGDLSRRESTLLAHLSPDRPRGFAEVAGHLGVAPSTLSEAVQPLVEAGLVRKVRDPEDGRRCRLALTAEGSEARADSSVLDRAILVEALASLSGRERALAVAGLRLLAVACRRARRSREEREAREGAS